MSIDLHDERLIQALLKTCNPNKLESDLARRLAQVANIKQAAARCEQLQREEIARHNSAMRGIEETAKRFREQCGHPVTKRHGDPSGNGDSWTECEVCGAEV